MLRYLGSVAFLRPSSVTLVLLILVIPQPAFAYLDPGTGSMMLQVLLAGLAGLLVVLRLYWKKIKAFLGLVPKDIETLENKSEEDS